jgi:molecular chaperone IbpA
MNGLTRFDTNALAQLNRALVGFDRIFDNIETRYANSSASSNYPPYNIEKIGENNYQIVLAVAGFSKAEVSVEIDQDQLIIRGEKTDPLFDATGNHKETEYLHRGLALRNFERRFTLAEHMEIETAEICNGLLTIWISRKIPETLLPRKIEIVELKD